MAGSINVNQTTNNVTVQDQNGKIIITDNNSGIAVNVTQPVANVITVSTPGPQGPVGPIPSSGAFTGSFSGSFIGDLTGTASNAVSASYAVNATNSTNATSASYAANATSASYALTASYLEGYISPFPYSGSAVITGSLLVSGSSTLTNIGPAIFSGSLIVTQGITGSLSGSALTATSASFATTASFALNVNPAATASYAVNALSASFALTASYLSGYVSPFPFTGSAIISGSLGVTGSVSSTAGFSGSFSGSFQGNGSGLTNIPASGITGLNLSQIATGSISASVSLGTGSFTVTSGSSTFMFVSSSGNVGIGTSNPIYKLQVNVADTTNACIFTAPTGNVRFLPYLSSVYGSYISTLNATQTAQIPLSFSANKFIFENGNLLINTTTDSGFKFDVNGTARIQSNTTILGTATVGGSSLVANAAFQVNTGGKYVNYNGAYSSGNFYTYQAFGSWDSYGSDIATGTILSIGGYRTSQWTGITFHSNGSERMRINSAGNIGIGTPTPLYKLDVSGSTNITSDLTVTGSLIAGPTSVSSFTASNATISGNVTVLGTASINTLIVNQTQFSTGSNQLGDAADDFQTLYGTVRIPTGSLTVTGSITQNASTASFGGLVGIGTTTPAYKLDVVGDIRASTLGVFGINSTKTIVLRPEATSGAYGNSCLISGGNGNGRLDFYSATNITQLTDNILVLTSVGGPSIQVGVSSIALNVAGSTRLAVAATTGNILIGTTTDAGFKLDVNGTARVTTSILVGPSSTQGTIQTGVFRGTYFNDYANNFTIFEVKSNGYASFYQGLAIGTSSNAVTSAQVEIVSTTKGFLPPRTNTTASISSPAQGLITYLTGSTNEGLYYYNSGSTPGWRQVADTTFVSASLSGSAGYVPVFTGANSVSSSVIFQSGSNVGIGTSTPSSSLHIKGSGITTSTTSFLVQNSSSIPIFSINDGSVVNLGGTGGSTQVRMYFNRFAGGTVGSIGAESSGAGTTLQAGSTLFMTNGSSGNTIAATQQNLGAMWGIRGFGTTSATTALLVQNSNSSASLAVLDNGNVGIGTAAPAYSLDVRSGDLFVTGSRVAYFTNIRPADTGGVIYFNNFGGTNAGRMFLDGSIWRFKSSNSTDTLNIFSNGNLGIRQTSDAGFTLDVAGTTRLNAGSGNDIITDTNVTINGYAGSGTVTRFQSRNAAAALLYKFTIPNQSDTAGNFIGNLLTTGSLQIAGTTRLSGSFNTATSGSILTVIGSGSAQPIFTVQGSQGELFSITDSLSGSLFSVNDISGLPILEVFSDNTTLIGNYQDPMLITTAKVVQTNSGSFTIYSLPTASYDTAFFEYSVRSGSNARAGTIMAIQSGSAVNFTETTTTDFGSTSAVSFTVIVTGSNMALTGSSTSGAWTIKTIVRGL